MEEKSHIPLFGPVFKVMDQIIKEYEDSDVQINSKVCLVLVNRVDTVRTYIARLRR